MKLFERLTRLVKADAHGVLDHLEQQALLAKQHLREAELELDRKRAREDAHEEEARGLEVELARLEAESASLDADVELALGEGEEELARFALRRLLPRRRAAASARRRLEELGGERRRLREIVASQERELETLRGRVQAKLAAARRGEASELSAQPAVADEEVELELLRRRGARPGTGAA